MRRDAEAEAVNGRVCVDCARWLGVYGGQSCAGSGTMIIVVGTTGFVVVTMASIVGTIRGFAGTMTINAGTKITFVGTLVIDVGTKMIFAGTKTLAVGSFPAVARAVIAHPSTNLAPTPTIRAIPPTFTQVTPAIADDHVTPQSKRAETRRHWASGTGHWCKDIAHASATSSPPPRLSAHSPSSSATRLSLPSSGLAGALSVGL